MYGGYTLNPSKSSKHKLIFRNDIYSSSDGINWKLEPSENTFTGRYDFQIVNFNENMFKRSLILVGGRSNTPLNDIWISHDAINWELMMPSAPFAPRKHFTLSVFDDML